MGYIPNYGETYFLHDPTTTKTMYAYFFKDMILIEGPRTKNLIEGPRVSPVNRRDPEPN